MDINEEGTIYYSTDGSTWQQYTNPIKLEKTATIYYYGVDANGNKAEAQEITVPVKTEETQPTTPVTPTPGAQSNVIPVTPTPGAQSNVTVLPRISSISMAEGQASVSHYAMPAPTTPQPVKKASYPSPHKTAAGTSYLALALIAILIIAALAYIKRGSILHAINNVKSTPKGK